MNFYTTGEVAKRLNLSVRTIRYYDQINLLKPTKKDENGKRLYSEDDLLTLEKITILKKLNLPLDDIKKVLSTITINQLLNAHRKSLEEKREEINDAIAYTNTLLNIVQLEGTIQWEQLLPLIKNAQEQNIHKNWDIYFNEEEKQILKHAS